MEDSIVLAGYLTLPSYRSVRSANDATLAACLLSKVTVRLIFPPVVLLLVVKMLEVDKSWRHLIQVSSRNGIKMDIF